MQSLFSSACPKSLQLIRAFKTWRINFCKNRDPYGLLKALSLLLLSVEDSYRDFIGSLVVSAPNMNACGQLFTFLGSVFSMIQLQFSLPSLKSKKGIIQRESWSSLKIFHSALRHETINYPTIIIAEIYVLLLSNYRRKSLCPINFKASQFLQEKRNS